MGLLLGFLSCLLGSESLSLAWCLDDVVTFRFGFTGTRMGFLTLYPMFTKSLLSLHKVFCSV